MYEQSFQLTDRPFRMIPQVDKFVPVECAEQARQNLARVIERAEGPGVLIGPTGTGKSLICQLLARQFGNVFQVAVLASAQLCSRRALLQTILFELGLPYRDMPEGELRLSLMDHLEPGPDCPNGLLLIVDEADRLPTQLLEEIRMMTNLVRDGEPRVRLVLAGGTQLEERLGHADLQTFGQRIAARCYLLPLGFDETQRYIQSHFSNVGGVADQVFAADAISEIYQRTDGVPRLINQLCDHALVMADVGGHRTISAEGVHEAWTDLQQLPSQLSQAEDVISIDAHGESTVIEFGQLEPEETDDSTADQNVEPREGELDQHQVEVRFDEIEQHVDDAASDDEAVEAADDSTFEIPSAEAITVSPPHVQIVVDVPATPFDGEYDEEEIVIDHYAALDARSIRKRPVVSSVESREIAAALLLIQTTHTVTRHDVVEEQESIEVNFDPASDPVMPDSEVQFTAEDAAQSPAATIQQPTDQDDRDIIIVEDENGSAVRRKVRMEQPRRQEYKQLFAKLRRG